MWRIFRLLSNFGQYFDLVVTINSAIFPDSFPNCAAVLVIFRTSVHVRQNPGIGNYVGGGNHTTGCIELNLLILPFNNVVGSTGDQFPYRKRVDIHERDQQHPPEEFTVVFLKHGTALILAACWFFLIAIRTPYRTPVPPTVALKVRNLTPLLSVEIFLVRVGISYSSNKTF